jgi:hypothetical protein
VMKSLLSEKTLVRETSMAASKSTTNLSRFAVHLPIHLPMSLLTMY